MSRAISIRLPDKLSHALESVADATERTKTYLVRRAVETYLAEYADYQIALDRLRDKDDAVISKKELRTRLGL